MLTAVSCSTCQVIANKIPILCAFTLVDRTAGTHRCTTVSAVCDPAKNTVAKCRIGRMGLCVFSEEMFCSVKLLLCHQWLMGIFCKAPIFLWNRDFLFGLHIDLTSFPKYSVPQIDAISQDTLDRSIIPVVRGS